MVGAICSDQRVASGVAQTNLGKQYLLDTLRCLDVEPGNIMETNISAMDKEREAEKSPRLNSRNDEERIS